MNAIVDSILQSVGGIGRLNRSVEFVLSLPPSSRQFFDEREGLPRIYVIRQTNYATVNIGRGRAKEGTEVAIHFKVAADASHSVQCVLHPVGDDLDGDLESGLEHLLAEILTGSLQQ